MVGRWAGFEYLPIRGIVRVIDVADLNAGEILAAAAMASLVFDARSSLRLTTRDFAAFMIAALFFLPQHPQNLPFIRRDFRGGLFLPVPPR